MPLMWRVTRLHMEWCLDCHRAPGRYIRPREQVFSMTWVAGEDQAVLGPRLVREYNVASLPTATPATDDERVPKAGTLAQPGGAGGNRRVPPAPGERVPARPLARFDQPARRAPVAGRVACARRRGRLRAPARGEDRSLRPTAGGGHSGPATLFRHRHDPRRIRPRGAGREPPGATDQG